MMELQQRIGLMAKLGDYLQEDGSAWKAAKQRAYIENGWFVEDFVNHAAHTICQQFLKAGKLEAWAKSYGLPEKNPSPKNLGLVMAGNIPMVGFHDFLCGFITGHRVLIKPSSKDSILLTHLINKLIEWNPQVANEITIASRLNGCDAYIATGSNNSGRYFEYYFRNHPSIIRKNRTSVAVLNGSETSTELENLADDLLLYFGLGCRNVSKLYVPRNYDFVPFLEALNKYKWMEEHYKFKNNYDYNLSLHLLNHQYYMTNGTLLVVEKTGLFAPISQINFEFYDGQAPTNLLESFPDDIQCVTGHGNTPFGQAQSPTLADYADGVDTMTFLKTI